MLKRSRERPTGSPGLVSFSFRTAFSYFYFFNGRGDLFFLVILVRHWHTCAHVEVIQAGELLDPQHAELYRLIATPRAPLAFSLRSKQRIYQKISASRLMVLLFHLGIFSQASRLTPRTASNSALLSQRSRSSAPMPGGHATPVRSCSYGQVSRPLFDREGSSMAFGGGSFSLTSPTRERRLTDFASCSSSAQRAEKRSSPSTAGAQGRDAGVSRGRSGHVRARDASGGPWCWRNLPNAAATVLW